MCPPATFTLPLAGYFFSEYNHTINRMYQATGYF
jgi:hypothetical protein